MSYIQRKISDTEPTEVFSGSGFGTAESIADAIDVSDFREIDWFISFDDKLTATSMSAVIQFSYKENPTIDADWFVLQTEEISSGTAIVEDYVVSRDLAPATGIAQFSIGSAVRGRTMRIVVTADATTSGATITALRRV